MIFLGKCLEHQRYDHDSDSQRLLFHNSQCSSVSSDVLLFNDGLDPYV